MTAARPSKVKARAQGLRPDAHTLPLFDVTELSSAIRAIEPAAGSRAAALLDAMAKSGPQSEANYPYGKQLPTHIKNLEKLAWAFIKRTVVCPECHHIGMEYDLDRQDPATAAALAHRSRQAGFIAPQLLNLLALVYAVLVVLVAIVMECF